MKANRMKAATCACMTLFLILAGPLNNGFPLKAQQNSPQAVPLKVNTKNIGGAYELTAESLVYGDLKVYLPDDMAAGDTISGTVVAEPKGATVDERAKNQNILNGYVLEVAGKKVTALDGQFTWDVPSGKSDKPVYMLKVTDLSTGKEVATSTLPVLRVPPTGARPQKITPDSFRLPAIGQQYRAVQVEGPFDGNHANTSLNWSGASSRNPDFEASAEGSAGAFALLAESPRKAVFRSPVNFTGPADVSLKEGPVEAKGVFRNVGVRLSAPKTNLKRGESTTMTLAVVGLGGLSRTVSVLLECRGTVTMEGGNTQFIQISPAQVSGVKIFTLTRTLTGQQTGGFAVTAAVFPTAPDICIWDDKVAGSFLMFNDSGDYIFGQPGVASVSGRGKLTKGDCTINLSHDSSDRSVRATLDTCAKKGSASLEFFNPQAKFTITDKNTTDTTCAVR